MLNLTEQHCNSMVHETKFSHLKLGQAGVFSHVLSVHKALGLNVLATVVGALRDFSLRDDPAVNACLRAVSLAQCECGSLLL